MKILICGFVSERCMEFAKELRRIGHEVDIVDRKECKDMVKKKKYDIIHENGYLFDCYCLKLGKKLGIPTILQIDDYWLETTQSPLSKIINFYALIWCKRFANLAKKIFVPCFELREKLIKEWKLLDDKVEVIPDGVPIEKFRQNVDCSDVVEKYNLKGFKVVLFVGSVGCSSSASNALSGLIYLIRAIPIILSRVENLKVIVVGGYVEENIMEYLSEETSKLRIGEVIKFCGIAPHDDVPKYISASDVCVAFEPSAKRIFEYMACGKPVVAQKNDFIKEIIEDGKEGYLLNMKNKFELARIITTILLNDDMAKEIGENCRKKVLEKYSWEGVTNKLIETYRKAMV
ncbi:MAG: glycosyltransferase family 4 protein [Candidatus Thermoplasmatota archaeon]